MRGKVDYLDEYIDAIRDGIGELVKFYLPATDYRSYRNAISEMCVQKLRNGILKIPRLKWLEVTHIYVYIKHIAILLKYHCFLF